MEEFYPSSKLGIGNEGVRVKFRGLESGMEEFEQSSMFRIGNGGVRTKFRSLESGMEEFEPSSRLETGNKGVRVKFRCLESGMEEFEPSSRFGTVMEEFKRSSDPCNRKWRSSSQVLTLVIGNGRVRAKFDARNR